MTTTSSAGARAAANSAAKSRVRRVEVRLEDHDEAARPPTSSRRGPDDRGDLAGVVGVVVDDAARPPASPLGSNRRRVPVKPASPARTPVGVLAEPGRRRR